MVLIQEFSERDYENHRLLCLEIQQQVSCDDLVIFSDEAHFHLSGTVNKQNFCYWLHNNLHEIQECLLHSPYVTVLCAIPKFHIWGPYFIEDDNGTVTVTSEQYCVMLNLF